MSIAPALVPQELRPRRTQLWLLAGRTTWGFGSRVARAGAPQAGRPENPWLRWPSALWRIPATIVSWLAFLPHPETLAAQGKAHLKVAPLTERTEPAPWWQRRAVAGLVFGVDLVGGAVLVVAVLSMTRNPVILAVLGITVLGVVAGIVETLNAGWRAAGRGAQRYDGLAQLRALGHTGPVGYAACYVSRRKGDGRALMHRWLAHIDEAGVALVIDARNPTLAEHYDQNYRFHPVDTDPLLMYRLPTPRP